jgi:hypothetical protein
MSRGGRPTTPGRLGKDLVDCGVNLSIEGVRIESGGGPGLKTHYSDHPYIGPHILQPGRLLGNGSLIVIQLQLLHLDVLE